MVQEKALYHTSLGEQDHLIDDGWADSFPSAAEIPVMIGFRAQKSLFLSSMLKVSWGRRAARTLLCFN
jgi:hypothetical protein